MKRFLFLPMFFVCLVTAYGQGSKFKKVDRTPADSTVVRSFTKDAQEIDGSTNVQMRSGGISNNSLLSNSQLPQLPGRINRDSVKAVENIPIDRKVVFIERERSQSQLRSSQLRSHEDVTLSFFRETPELHIPKPESQIRIDKTDVDELGMAHVKGIQMFRNVPVYGMDFTFHISTESERFMGYTLDSTLIDTITAKLSAEDAIRIAERDLSQTTAIKAPGEFMKKIMQYERPGVESVYYPVGFNNYRFCFKVVIRPNMRDEWIYYIDAYSGKIVEKYNNTPIAGPAKGTGRDVFNVQRTVDTYEENGIHYMVNATKPMFNAASFTGSISVYDAKNNKNFHTGASIDLATSSSSQWNNPQAISAMYNASLVYDYLRQTFNRNSFDGNGASMLAIVNVPDEDGTGYDNAFWNNQFVALGNGNVMFSSLAGGLDVIAHEFGHAVVSQTAKLEYKNQSGAVNECFADIFGAMVDRANWTIGETVIKNRTYYPTGALRDMSNPHNGGKSISDACWQPVHVSEMYLGTEDNGGVHVNSGIPNYAFYTYATATSKDKAEKVFYRALSNYLTPVSKFIDLRIAVMQSARDLYGNTDAQLLANAFDKVGIFEDSGSAKPTDLPTNPGQQGILLANTDYSDRYGLYKTTDYKSFTPLTTSWLNSKPSVTDNGKYVVYVDDKTILRLLDMTTGSEERLSDDSGYASVAISRDGNRLAFVTTDEDARIYVHDFVSGKMVYFKLYNPTTGSGGAQSGGVRYADAIEFDHSGEYLIYDAYNVVGRSFGNRQVDFWDIGVIHVWDNQRKTFGTGEVEKLFSALESGVSVGNPVFSKNSPYIIAFDYFDTDDTYATFGVNLATADLEVMFLNSFPSYPSYSMDDKRIAFTTLDEEDYTLYLGYFNLGNDKITTTGNPSIFVSDAIYPVYYGTGTRQLGVKPVAAFTADVRSGGNPLSVLFVDQSENNPTSWNWTFQGGSPSSSTQQYPRVTYNNNGTYPVRLVATNSYGSHETTKQGYITVSATGVEFVEQATVTVYPNPASDYVRVSGAADKPQAVKLFDITGKVMPAPCTHENDKIKIDISSLHQGIYFIQVARPDGSLSTHKIVKQ